ncbi:hypothetical protein EEJ42_31815 [Streptomyces botrytidirepellens]|uniref:Uncharacterized protein n=1 Tax=Streptomyces botrytidirepellens TaxID=2486417 RepID=A0A3M8V627_9ACTN|nr:hypothetical protein EEJ42_31815 [Streptomyces botrytidirepellens]
MISGNGHAKCETFRSLGTRPNSVLSQTTASMRSATGWQGTRLTAHFDEAPGKWDQTIYHHTHPHPPRANSLRQPTIPAP